MALLYWVPMLGPCLFFWVGSWHVQKSLEEGLVGDGLGVKDDVDSFGVACLSCADLFVGGVLGLFRLCIRLRF